LGAGLCDPCPFGTFNNESGKSACSVCPSGRWTVDVGYTSKAGCTICAAGYNRSSSSCVECPLGFASIPNGNCTICPKGRYSNAPGSSCTFCSTGRFAQALGSSYCELCPAGRAPQETNSTICIDCTPGKYDDRSGTICTDCSFEVGVLVLLLLLRLAARNAHRQVQSVIQEQAFHMSSLVTTGISLNLI
jgi:hypothetical protein